MTANPVYIRVERPVDYDDVATQIVVDDFTVHVSGCWSFCDATASIEKLERERNAQADIATAYDNALADIREKLGLSEHAEHEEVTDAIERMRAESEMVVQEILERLSSRYPLAPVTDANERIRTRIDTLEAMLRDRDEQIATHQAYLEELTRAAGISEWADLLDYIIGLKDKGEVKP